MIRYATLNWKEDGTPESAMYGDVYFSRPHGEMGGREECEHVFMAGCGLPEKWKDATLFTLGETGFGTGLNMLHAWQRFEETAPADAQLHLMSVEAHPLSPADMARALQGWQGSEAQQLLAQYPLPIPGWHRMQFGRVRLTLGFGEAATLLAEADATVDAWFLDGFAPAKNTSMWGEDVLRHIARLSHAGTTLASFTAAGEVRRGLEAVGFAIEKRAGFGHKRHAIAGVMKPAHAQAVPHTTRTALRHVTIVGAGIAGASLAHTLATRGLQVQVIERADAVASAASGNPAGVLYPHITQQFGANMAWHLAGFAHAVRMVKHAPFATLCGMLKTPKDAKDELRLRTACESSEADVMRWVEPEEAEALLGVRPPMAGAWFGSSGWVEPKRWCEALLQHANIRTRCGTALLAHTPHAQGVELTLHQQQAAPHNEETDCLIFANAAEADTHLPQLAGRMFPSAGQISLAPRASLSAPLKAVLCHRGYVMPHHDETALIGATYDHHNFSTAVTAENHAKNASEAERALPGWLQDTDVSTWGGRTALRASTRDRLPLVGEVQPRVWVSVGHGSRGMVSAPYAAEVIASQLLGEPVPASRSLREAVHPLRGTVSGD